MLKKTLILFFVLLLVCSTAYANISIYPYNLDFETLSRKRVQSIRVINKSNKRQTYRVSIIDLSQDKNGNLKEVSDSENSAKKYLQFSPRQFTLEPNLVQTINIAQKGLSNVPDNEFFSFIQISETKIGEPEKEQTSNKKNLSIELVPLFSVRIPVKILKGNDFFNETTIESYEVISTKQSMNVFLKRKGNVSSNVNLVLINSENEEIARLNSIKIYIPNDKLKINFKLDKKLPQGENILKVEDAKSKEEISQKIINN